MAVPTGLLVSSASTEAVNGSRGGLLLRRRGRGVGLDLLEVDDLDTVLVRDKALKVALDVDSLQEDGGAGAGQVDGVLGGRVGDFGVEQEVKGLWDGRWEGKGGNVVLGSGGRNDLFDQVF